MSGTPEEVFRRGLGLLLAKDMDGFADLWAKDGTIEYPFAAPGAPTRIEGREEVRRYLADFPQMVDYGEFAPVTVHRTQDPEVIVVEFGARGRAVQAEKPFEMRYVAVVTVRDGSIVSYRDYMSPIMGAQALGDLPALASALEEQSREQAHDPGRG